MAVAIFSFAKEKPTKDLSYSTLTCNTIYVPNTTMDLEFTLDLRDTIDYNNESAYYLSLTFPTDIKPNGTAAGTSEFIHEYTDDYGSEQHRLPFKSIEGQTITWDEDGTWFVMLKDYTATFTVNVTIGDISGGKQLEWFLKGDDEPPYGAYAAPNKDGGSQVVGPLVLSDGTISTDATLSSLTVDGVTVPLEVGKYEYDVEIPEGHVFAQIEATPTDGGSTFVISENPLMTIPGNVTITVTASDAITELVYTIHVDTEGGGDTTAIANIENHLVINAFPNPTTGVLNFTNIKNSKIVVYNVLGKVVSTISNVSESVNLSSLEKGTYFVKIISNQNITTKKISLIK